MRYSRRGPRSLVSPKSSQTWTPALAKLAVALLLVGAGLFYLMRPGAAESANPPDIIVTDGTNLIKFNSSTPGTASTVAISGLNSGEMILGLDFRPATEELFGLGGGSRLYVINPVTGAAVQRGSDGAFTLSGSDFGFDFNPIPDRIRVVSDADQDLRLNPNDGTAVTDTALAYDAGDTNSAANPNVTGSAYTNNFQGTTATTLYGIDTNLDILVTQFPPNNGTLHTVGPLGFNTTGLTGFDIHTTGD